MKGLMKYRLGYKLNKAEELYYEFIVNKLYLPIKHAFLYIKYGLENFWVFRKEIWNFRGWDHCYMYDLLIKSLNELEKHQRLYGNATEQHKKAVIKKIILCKCALQRIRNDEYDFDTLSKACDLYPLKFDEDPILNEDGSVFGYRMLDSGPKADELFKQHREKSAYLKKQDWELFKKYFGMSECFWD